MFCPQCRTQYHTGLTRCAGCDVPLVDSLPEVAGVADPPAPSGALNDATADPNADLDALIYTSLYDPIATSLLESLLQEAEIPYFVVNQSVAARQRVGNWLGGWMIRVPRAREAEAREILESVETAK